jgi:Protein of unknown function (DUF2971)
VPIFRSALENGLNSLFHYQRYNAGYLRNTVERRIIRFGRASEFNDPWDCKPEFFVPVDDPKRLRRLVEYMQRASERHTPDIDPAERAARTQHFLHNPHELSAAFTATSAEMWTQMDMRYRVFCLSAKPNSHLMWGHYADHHRGICLEFDVRTSLFSSATQVNYNASYPEYALDSGGALSPFYTKSSDWSYEEEYRLVAQEEAHALAPGTLMTRDGFFQFSEKALVSIIIGASASTDVIREIREIAGSDAITVKKATRVPHRYELAITA